MPTTAQQLIQIVRQSASALAVAVMEQGNCEVGIDEGADPVDETTLFEIGSVTKTLTALLLAQMVVAGETTFDTAIGDVMAAGDNGKITLAQLATHTSGLPRLPHNLMAKAQATPDDPYSTYEADDLEADLQAHPVQPAPPDYSNYGFMVLGLVLSRIGNQSLGSLLRDRVFLPLGMTSAILDAAVDAPRLRVQGYAGNQPVPHWTKPLPGAGGVEASITDMTTYARALLDPSGSALAAALELTLQPPAGHDVCLSWQRAGSLLWHNGGTGGFSSFIGFDRDAGRAVVMLSNSGGTSDSLSAIGMAALVAGG